MTSSDLLAEKTSLWLEAAQVRKSRRRYDSRPVSEDLLADLSAVCSGFAPWPDARTVLVRDTDESVFTGIVGSYGKIIGARNVLLFIADSSSPTAQHHAGYTGEAAILHATALGLATCWIGGAFSPRLAIALTDLAPAEKVVAVSPVGHAAEMGFTDHSMRMLARSSSRKRVEEIASGIGETWPVWARDAVHAARLAPSAVNRQPWRFRLDGDELVVSRDQRAEVPKVTRALDCGIAMLHAELAARHAGATGRWVDATGDGLDVARFRIEG